MATRRDELNAYSFARRRTVAAFLQPSPHGSEEGAPRPLKTVLPSLGVGVLVLVGFGAWGMLSPTAPKGWDNVGEKVLVGSESTTRYVLVKTKGEQKASLHPVLNLASARLLLKPDKFEVVKVKESVLDESKYSMGATIGIPFAPDRLPSKKDAESAKVWSLCEAPGGGEDKKSRKATYVLDNADYEKLLHRGKGELGRSGALYVEGPPVTGDGRGNEYMVTSDGRAYLIGGEVSDDESNLHKVLRLQLKRAMLGDEAQPQEVSKEFLGTLLPGGVVEFPKPEGAGTNADLPGVDPKYTKVGLVLSIATASGKEQQYVVLKKGVQRVSPFTAQLLLRNPYLEDLYEGEVPEPVKVSINDIIPVDGEWMSEMKWPASTVEQSNTQSEGGNSVSCSVYHGKRDDITGLRKMTMWVGRDYPKDVSQSGSSSYVSPGSGLLFKRVTGTAGGGGNVYLVTDTGLRYSVPATNDSSVTGAAKGDQEQTNTAQMRLGYDKVLPASVPAAWADLLAAGPELSSGNAEQAQGS